MIYQNPERNTHVGWYTLCYRKQKCKAFLTFLVVDNILFLTYNQSENKTKDSFYEKTDIGDFGRRFGQPIR
jgi:hypothetical protein